VNREAIGSFVAGPEFGTTNVANDIQAPTTSGPVPGWIYCICNDSMPDLVKIGLTRNNVEERMRQLDTTGVATPFKIVHQWLSADIARDERNLHQLLDSFRVRSNREWFRVPKAKRANLIVFVNRYMLRTNGRYYQLDGKLPKGTRLSLGEMLIWAQTKLGIGFSQRQVSQGAARPAGSRKQLGIGSWAVICLFAFALIGAMTGTRP
jgi:hypothetical protein